MKQTVIWIDVNEKRKPKVGKKVLLGYTAEGTRSVTVGTYSKATGDVDVWVDLVTNGQIKPDYWALAEHPA